MTLRIGPRLAVYSNGESILGLPIITGSTLLVALLNLTLVSMTPPWSPLIKSKIFWTLFLLTNFDIVLSFTGSEPNELKNSILLLIIKSLYLFNGTYTISVASLFYPALITSVRIIYLAAYSISAYSSTNAILTSRDT